MKLLCLLKYLLLLIIVLLPLRLSAAECLSEASWIQNGALFCDDFNDGTFSDWSFYNNACHRFNSACSSPFEGEMRTCNGTPATDLEGISSRQNADGGEGYSILQHNRDDDIVSAGCASNNSWEGWGPDPLRNSYVVQEDDEWTHYRWYMYLHRDNESGGDLWQLNYKPIIYIDTDRDYPYDLHFQVRKCSRRDSGYVDSDCDGDEGRWVFHSYYDNEVWIGPTNPSITPTDVLDSWACFELAFKPSTHEVKLWINDTLIWDASPMWNGNDEYIIGGDGNGLASTFHWAITAGEGGTIYDSCWWAIDNVVIMDEDTLTAQGKTRIGTIGSGSTPRTIQGITINGVTIR